MSLKKLNGFQLLSIKSLSVILVLFAFLFAGCGEVEEATTQEKQKTPEQTPQTAAPAQEMKKEGKPMQEALTSFIGNDADQYAEAAPQPAPALSATQMAQYEKQIDDLRIENTTLKQKVVKLEQENRGINARIGEYEAKYAAEKLRADKAEDLTRTPAPPIAKVVEDKTETAPAASEGTYEDALNAYRAKNFTAAEKGFKAIVDAGADDALTNRASYWLGESYYANKKYKAALPMFQKTLKYKNSEKKADAQFMLAQTYEKLKNKAKAKAAYEKVVKNYPMSKNVKRAKERWAKL